MNVYRAKGCLSRYHNAYILRRLCVYMSKGNRAQTIPHVEHEVLKEVLNNIPLDDLHDAMVADEASEKRFKKGAGNVAKLIRNLMVRRQHRLPFDHEDYKEKED